MLLLDTITNFKEYYLFQDTLKTQEMVIDNIRKRLICDVCVDNDFKSELEQGNIGFNIQKKYRLFYYCKGSIHNLKYQYINDINLGYEKKRLSYNGIIDFPFELYDDELIKSNLFFDGKLLKSVISVPNFSDDSNIIVPAKISSFEEYFKSELFENAYDYLKQKHLCSKNNNSRIDIYSLDQIMFESSKLFLEPVYYIEFEWSKNEKVNSYLCEISATTGKFYQFNCPLTPKLWEYEKKVQIPKYIKKDSQYLRYLKERYCLNTLYKDEITSDKVYDLAKNCFTYNDIERGLFYLRYGIIFYENQECAENMINYLDQCILKHQFSYDDLIYNLYIMQYSTKALEFSGDLYYNKKLGSKNAVKTALLFYDLALKKKSFYAALKLYKHYKHFEDSPLLARRYLSLYEKYKNKHQLKIS